MNNIRFAIEYLKNNSHKMIEKGNNYAVQSVKMAISALEQQLTNGWIPIRNKYDYPFVNGDYLITVRYENFAGIYDKTTMATFDGSEWTIYGVQPYIHNKKIIAWKGLDKPYKGE